MTKVLIDTDVLIDFLAERQPHADFAEQIFLVAAREEICLFTTGDILSNAYYVLRKIFSHSKILAKFSQLLRYMEVIDINKQVILNAISSGFRDFEDALQNYAAEHSGEIDIIVTRNVKDYKHSSISVMTPLDFSKSL
ncbi:PIN domain-containing protein [Ekhidna sp.]|uniref:PIN domain-containing protein n=1 Tax=Ekhidna sp. TaxID=2608089 RepID=UPI003CCBBC03